MSRQAQQQREQMGLALRRQADPEKAAAPRPPRVKPVRITVDLAPDLHRRLKLWAVNADDARLADVVRVLTERMLTDETLAESIRDDLAARKLD